jgi:hypothetical protein
MASSQDVHAWSGAAWFVLAAISAWLLSRAVDPAPLVAVGAALAAAFPARFERGWASFIASSLTRAGDVILAGGAAWYLAAVAHDASGAGVAAAALSLAVICAYTQTRARALSIPEPGPRPSRERVPWLVVVAVALWLGSGSQRVLVWGLGAAAAYSTAVIVRRWTRIWVVAPRG